MANTASRRVDLDRIDDGMDRLTLTTSHYMQPTVVSRIKERAPFVISETLRGPGRPRTLETRRLASQQQQTSFSTHNLSESISDHVSARVNRLVSNPVKIAKEHKINRVPKVECTACTTEYGASLVLAVSCRHVYCFPCINQIFTTAIQDPMMYPPKCCGRAINLSSSVKDVLLPHVFRTFKLKKKEYEPSLDAVYCHDTICSSFIRRKFIQNNVATCPYCRKQTCVVCKALRHRRDECPRDAALTALMTLAKSKEWKRCPRCLVMTEKSEGCNHINCRYDPWPTKTVDVDVICVRRCSAHWCYKCGGIMSAGHNESTCTWKH